MTRLPHDRLTYDRFARNILRFARKTLRFAAVTALALAPALSLTGCDVVERFTGGEARAETNGDAPGDTPGAPARADREEQVFAVNVTPAVQGRIADYLEINGDVQTTTSVDVFSSTAGEVARVHVRVGQTVEADELLMEVDASRPGQQFAPSPVRSPIAGTVTRLPAQVGSQVTPSAPAAQVSRTTDLEIVVSIPERFISQVRTGLNAEVRLDAFPGERFPARVTELNPVVDPLTRTLEVKLRFTRGDPRVRAGMFAEVRIITEEKDNIVKVPADVMVRRFGETFVFVVPDRATLDGEEPDGEAPDHVAADDEAVDDPDGEREPEVRTVERRAITPGILIDNTLEVTAGLDPDELVVYQGQALLEDQAQVRIINRLDVLDINGDSDTAGGDGTRRGSP